MRQTLDENIAEALKARTLVKSRHGALIQAAQMCADLIDITDDPTASMFTTMLNYIRALGLAPSNEEIDRRRKARPKDEGMDGMRAKFHAVS